MTFYKKKELHNSTVFVRKFGQILFLAIFIAVIGIMNFLAFFTINRQEVFLVEKRFGKKPSKNPRKSSTKICDFQTDKFSRSAILALIKSSRKNTKKNK